MSEKLKHAAQAWVFAVVFFIYDMQTLVAPSGERRMMSPEPLTAIVWASLAQILLIALLYGGVLALLRKFTPWNKTQWIAIAVTVVLLGVRLRPYVPALPHSRFHPRLIVLAVLSLCILLAVTKFPRATLQLKSGASSVFAGLVVFAILISGELAHLLFWHPAPQQFSHAASAPEDPNRPRLVWIIFDELDYYQAFGHRDATLQMPNFDKLRDQSMLYTDVSPVRKRTFEAVPSFLGGSVVTQFRYTWDNRIEVRTEDHAAWHPFDPENTVFGAAHRAGLRSSMVGWAIPYCFTFSAVVDQCYWNNENASWDGPALAPQDGFVHDFWAPLRYLVVTNFDPHAALRPYLTAMAIDHERSVDDLTAHALDSLRESHADVIYLHIPVPHPPAARNRLTHQFAVGGSFLDSLSHADDVLGELMHVLEAQPRWQHTTLLVQGDHGWRDWGGHGWVPEDRRLWFSSPQNLHPVVLVHRPGQTGPETMSAPVNVMGVRDIGFQVLQQMKH